MGERRDKTSRQIQSPNPFAGEKLDMDAIWRARDRFFPAPSKRK
jgi:hypothetical protein